MTVTPLYAGLLGLLLVLLSARVILLRRSAGVSLGSAGNDMLERRIRAQANLAEYAPIALILIGALELSGYPGYILHAVGILLVAGRAVHGFALSFARSSGKGRVSAMALTLASISMAALLNLWHWAGSGAV